MHQPPSPEITSVELSTCACTAIHRSHATPPPVIRTPTNCVVIYFSYAIILHAAGRRHRHTGATRTVIGQSGEPQGITTYPEGVARHNTQEVNHGGTGKARGVAANPSKVKTLLVAVSGDCGESYTAIRLQSRTWNDRQTVRQRVTATETFLQKPRPETPALS